MMKYIERHNQLQKSDYLQRMEKQMKGMGSWDCIFFPTKIKKGTFSLDLKIHFFMCSTMSGSTVTEFGFASLTLKNGPQKDQ